MQTGMGEDTGVTWPSTSPGERSQKTTPSIPWSQTSSLPNCEEINFCCYTPPISDTLLWQLQQTDTALKGKEKEGALFSPWLPVYTHIGTYSLWNSEFMAFPPRVQDRALCVDLTRSQRWQPHPGLSCVSHRKGPVVKTRAAEPLSNFQRHLISHQ